jgi:hypothetical protein
MTQPFDDEYGERLRRALHAEAEAVTPSAEGLERIRTKINERHERRLGLFAYSAPWLRPLAAVTAALAVCLAGVSITPALANFVQTGHFSPDSGGDGGHATSNGSSSQGQVFPGRSSAPVPNTSPSPSSIRPSNTGKHVVMGSCPAGEDTVSPSSSPPPASGPSPTITCQAPTAPGGGATSSAPATEPGTPPASSAPEEPPSQPTEQSGPPAVSNPNQSP